MKVLWFSNTPSNADEYLKSSLKGTGGWLKSLDRALQDHLVLSVAFFAKKAEIFRYRNTDYYSISTKKSIIRKIINKFFNTAIDKVEIHKYLAIINEVKPDIIHIHGTEEPFSSIIPYTEIPVVVSIQGNITVYHHKYLSGFDKKYLRINDRSMNCFKKLVFPYSFRHSFKAFEKMKIREERNLKFARYIFGRTDWDKRITRILAPKSNYFHVDEILRDSFYQSQWLPNSQKKLIIHTTSGNNFYKGFETLCLSLNELNVLDLECDWLVAGINPSDLIVKVTKMKLKNKFPKKGLKLLGNLSERELVESLLSADMYVMVSHIENSPNNLCEAMILGIPCISTFVGGVGTLVKDHENGLLIQDGDPWAMAGAILELANDKEASIQLGRNARNDALIRHDKQRIVKELINHYIEILSIHRSTIAY